MLTTADLHQITGAMAGVRSRTVGGREEWRYHGRLVACRLDPGHLVIRADFGVRDELVRCHRATFSVPARYARHMMVVADLAHGDGLAIEDALQAAWQLQRAAD